MRYVVVGLHAAGRSACAWLRRLAPHAEIVGVDPKPLPPYARPLISYALSGEVGPELLELKEKDFFEDLGVTLALERAKSLDPDRRVLTLESGREVTFDKLLIATGASPRQVDISGAGEHDVLYFRCRSDLERVLDRVVPGGVAAVLGGGLVGFKLTMGLLARGMKVKLIVASPRPLSLNVDEHVGSIIAQRLAALPGVELLTNSSVRKMAPGKQRRHSVTLEDGRSFEVDLVAAGKGVLPETGWLAGSGLAGTGLACEDGIEVDNHLQTKAQGVFAAGDAAKVWDVAHQSPQVNAIWPMAVEQARYAAWNMAGPKTAYPGALAMNSIPVFGGFMISVGAVNPRYTSGCDFETVEPGKGSYVKLVFREQRLIGAVGLNAAPRLGELAWAVRRGLTRAQVPNTWLSNTSGAAPLAGASRYLSGNVQL